MEADINIQNYFMRNKIYLLKQAFSCSDLGTFTDVLNTHIEYNLANKKKNESQVSIEIILRN